MNKEKIIAHWFANLYDQLETDINDVDFLIKVIGEEPKNILEVCCGSGRILVPLAKASHWVVGFDNDEEMLSKIKNKAINLENLKYYKADAILDSWKTNFDVCILAGNILMNIVSDLDYKEAQKLLIKKAYDCLRKDGHIYLDFNLFAHPNRIYNNNQERVIFQGTDNSGVTGKYSILNSRYDDNSQMLEGISKTTLITKENDQIVVEKEYAKHIPTQNNIEEWLTDVGFTIEKVYGDYNGNLIGEKTSRCIIYAKK